MLERLHTGDEVVAALDLVGDGAQAAVGLEGRGHLVDRPRRNVDPPGVDAQPAKRLDEQSDGTADVEHRRRPQGVDDRVGDRGHEVHPDFLVTIVGHATLVVTDAVVVLFVERGRRVDQRTVVTVVVEVAAHRSRSTWSSTRPSVTKSRSTVATGADAGSEPARPASSSSTAGPCSSARITPKPSRNSEIVAKVTFGSETASAKLTTRVGNSEDKRSAARLCRSHAAATSASPPPAGASAATTAAGSRWNRTTAGRTANVSAQNRPRKLNRGSAQTQGPVASSEPGRANDRAMVRAASSARGASVRASSVGEATGRPGPPAAARSSSSFNARAALRAPGSGLGGSMAARPSNDRASPRSPTPLACMPTTRTPSTARPGPVRRSTASWRGSVHGALPLNTLAGYTRSPAIPGFWGA